MIPPAMSVVSAWRITLGALLMGIFSLSWGEELSVPDEAPGRVSSKTTDTHALEETIDPSATSGYRSAPTTEPKSMSAQSSQGNTPGRTKQPGVAIRTQPVRITHHHNAGAQFERIQAALMQGNIATAMDLYEDILKGAPRNTDAILGLALIQLRKGNTAIADTLVSKALATSPRDPLALALLSPLRTGGNPAQEESRLLQALIDQSDASPLHFALGNLYAKQNRWSEAEQAYFKATMGDRDHPDYLFNLAVSLEHIHQPQAAKQYYQDALVAADLRPAAFSRTVASTRADSLDRSLP